MIVTLPRPTTDELGAALVALFAAEDAGVRFRVHDGALQFGPSGAVTTELREMLAEPATKRILTAVVAGDPEIAEQIAVQARWQTALNRVDLPAETVKALRGAGVVIEEAGENYEELFLLVGAADRDYFRERPARTLPPMDARTGRPVDWPASDSLMTFGKHKGKSLGSVAATYEGREYLRWLVAGGAGTEDLRRDIASVLGMELPDDEKTTH